MMVERVVAALFLTLLASAATIAKDAAISPYAGQEKREIKALSSEEIAAYLEGKGMALAKAAELNHYPGPAHVLALSAELALTPDQRARTEKLFKSMETEAISIGKQLIERERQLDDMFASKTITQENLQQALEAIAVLQGKVRQVHLQTHLVQAEILNPEQIHRYDELRGYTKAANSPQHEHTQRH
jgi:hypothetical protein